MKSVRKALFAIEKTREIGQMTGVILSGFPGWNRVEASRYLSFLCECGWLEKVNSSGHPRYVLGRKCLSLMPDVRL